MAREMPRSAELQNHGDKPITVTFDLKEPVPKPLW
jgi:hypothetical protein